MAKAVEGSHAGDGLYAITEVIDDTPIMHLTKAALDKRDELEQNTIPSIQAIFDADDSEFNDAMDVFDNAINVLAGLDATKEKEIEDQKAIVREKMGIANGAKLKRASSEHVLRTEKAKLASVKQEIKTLNDHIYGFEIASAWSADLANGDLEKGVAEHDFTQPNGVGIIQLNNDGDSNPIIHPKGGNGDAYLSFYGTLKKAKAPTPWATFWNTAMLGGFQKWLPNYKAATILSIDTDTNTCSVAYDEHQSAGVSTNQSDSHANVPIVYMSCNSYAFTTGDHVVVEFTGNDFDSPTVIGFVKEPKECDSTKLILSKSTSSSNDGHEDVRFITTGKNSENTGMYGPYCQDSIDILPSLEGDIVHMATVTDDSLVLTTDASVKVHTMSYGGNDYKYHYEGSYTRHARGLAPFAENDPFTSGCDNRYVNTGTTLSDIGKAVADIYFVMGRARIPVLVGTHTIKKENDGAGSGYVITRTQDMLQAEIEWICADGRYWSYIELHSQMSYVYVLSNDPLPSIPRTQTRIRKTLDENGYSETVLSNNNTSSVLNEPDPNEGTAVGIGITGHGHHSPWNTPTATVTSGSVSQGGQYDGGPYFYLNYANSFQAGWNMTRKSKYSISSVAVCPP